MPTILRVGPYRFFFYATDRTEPIHVHVERENFKAKFWLLPVRLSDSAGFSVAELSRIRGIIGAHEGLIVERWHDFFNN
jgi:hypothetical protein